MIDRETQRKLRMIQADKIRKTKGSVSMSSVINETLKKGLK